MTDRYERIRAALAMGPTPGPWDGDDNSVSRLWSNGTAGIREYIALPDGAEGSDPNPDAIRALLEERDVLRDEVERLRARVADLERDLDACRVELLEARHTDLRDSLAAKAIQGLLANPSGPIQANGMSGWGLCNCTIEQVADFAWHIADHMLKARGGSNAG